MPSPLAPGPPSPLQIDPMHSMLEHPGAGGLIAPTAAVGAEAATIPKRMMEASEELRTTGEYDPAPGGELILDMLALGPLAAERSALGAAGGMVKAAKRMTEVPDIRGLTTKDAVAIARKEPHLIPKKEGGFVGGPPGINTMDDLKKLRRAFDKFVEKNPEGGSWYNRYREAITEVTGDDKQANLWLSSALAQWSAGVAPEIEASFALKESNAAIAGMPVKAARPAQHEAHMRAIETQDPSEYLLGKKTGQYARFISPDQATPPGATGVNDFRYARQWGYPTLSGQSNAGGRGIGQGAAHTWLDYETALAVDRANKRQLGGRSDWTGEQLQAVPWIRQKGEAIAEKRKKLTPEQAYAEANTTFGSFLDKHTAFATHEAQPGAAGHMPGAETATQAEREAYAADPRSTWMDPATGRDVIYGGMDIPGTGVAMRVRPSTPMQGLYTTPAGTVETNPGWTARPLVAFETGKVKTTAAADQMLLNAGEATRGYLDAQKAAAWHKPWLKGQPGKSNSLFIPFDRKLTPDEILDLQKRLEPYGISDVVDTGRGVTVTRFWPPPDPMKSKRAGEALREVGSVLGPVKGERAAVSSDIIDYSSAWEQGVGSGAATRQVLEHVTATPEIRAALNNNGKIAQKALGNLERDEEWRSKWQAPREDIQNARRIVGEGPGWVDRLEKALKSGAVLPATVAAVLGSAALYQSEQPGRAQQ